MSGCCDPSGYRKVFRTKEALRAVRNFEKKGLDRTAGPMVEALRERGIEGTTLLEVGAGSGSAQVVLLESGVERSVAYDISSAYEDVAGALLQGRGLADRVEWHTGDFVADTDAAPADVVFLNRVVCCYDDMEALVDAAAGRADRLIAMSYPRDRLLSRIVLKPLNLFLRLRKVPFQVFVHDPDEIDRRVRAAGLSPAASGTTPIWRWTVWERAVA